MADLVLDINTLTGGPAVGEYVSLALATPDRVRGQGWVISRPDEHQVTSPPAVVDLRPTSEFESGTLYIVWWRGARGFTFAKTDTSQRLSEIDLMPVPETNAPAGIKLTDIRDTPETYAGQAGRALVVLDDESGTGFQRVASHDDIEAAEAAADKATEDVARLAGQLETLADLEKGDVSSLTAQVNQNDNAITDLQRVTAENTGEISSEASTRRDADTALGKRIDGVRAEFPEFITQLVAEPAGVAQASDLTREFSLLLGERLDVPAATRFLAVFAQNRNRDVSDEVQVVAYDARLPPQSVSFAVKQPNLAAVGVRSQDTGLNMALSFLDAGRQVIGDKPFTVPFAIGIGAAFGAGGDVKFTDLPPWAVIVPEPAGITGSEFPDHIDFVFTERIGSPAITKAGLIIEGQTDGIALSPTTPVTGVSDRGRLLFTIAEATRVTLSNNLSTESEASYVLTLVLSDGRTHVHNGVFLVNDNALRPIPLILQPPVAAGNTAGVTSVVLPVGYATYQNLRLDLWDVGRSRIAEATLSAPVLAAQTAAVNAVLGTTGRQEAHRIEASWTPATRTLAVTTGDRIIYAALE